MYPLIQHELILSLYDEKQNCKQSKWADKNGKNILRLKELYCTCTIYADILPCGRPWR